MPLLICNGPQPAIKPFTEIYQQRVLKWFGHILRLPDAAPERQVTVWASTAEPRLYGVKRVGKPRLHWTTMALKLAWVAVCEFLPEEAAEVGNFDCTNPDHISLINFTAHMQYF